MARMTGAALAVCWTYSGGSIWLNDDFRSFDVSRDVNDVDSTAGDDTYAGHLPTFADASADLNMLGTTSMGTAFFTHLAPRTEGTVYWYPEGTAVAKPKHYAQAYIQTFNDTLPYDNVREIDVTFQFMGAPTDTVV